MTLDDPQLRAATTRFLIANRFLVALLEIARSELGVTDAILLLGIVQANAAALGESAEQQLRYAGADQPPPARLRQPISILALADSLGIPFETVRRRVSHLAAQGYCEIEPEGCRASDWLLAPDRHGPLLMDCWTHLRHAYVELMAQGLLEGLVETIAPASNHDRTRLVGRAAGDFCLRCVGQLRGELSDYVDVALFQSIVDVCCDPRDPNLIVPSRFISAVSLARRLRLPPETARRRLRAMERAGVLSRGLVGWRPDTGRLLHIVQATAQAHLISLRRLSAILARHGVLANWMSATSSEPKLH